MRSNIGPDRRLHGFRSSFSRAVRLLASLSAGGLLLQAASGGCSQNFSDFVSTMGQDLVKGIGTGVTNLAEALVLNLFL